MNQSHYSVTADTFEDSTETLRRAMPILVTLSNGTEKVCKVYSVDEAFALCRSMGALDWKPVRQRYGRDHAH